MSNSKAREKIDTLYQFVNNVYFTASDSKISREAQQATGALNDLANIVAEYEAEIENLKNSCRG